MSLGIIVLKSYTKFTNFMKSCVRKATPKSAVFAEKGNKQVKLLFKLVIETMKYQSVLKELIGKTKIEANEKWIGKGRLLCLVYEFLIGDGVRKRLNLSDLTQTLARGLFEDQRP